MKARTILVAAVMFFGLSAAAFAQATYGLSSIPVTAVVRSGQTEKTGDIIFPHISGASVAGTISISYGVPITVPFTSVTVTSGGGYVAPPAPGTPPSIDTAASSNSAGILVINVPAGVTSGSIRVSGVRVAVAGTSLTSLAVSISSTGNAITAGQTVPVVVNSIAAGISAVSMSPSDGAVINAVSGIVTGSPARIRVTEGFLSAFGLIAGTAGDPTQTISTMVQITLSAAPPAGVTLTFPLTASTIEATTASVVVAGAFTIADCGDGTFATGNVNITSTSTSLAVCYRVSINTDATQLESLQIPVTPSVSGTATLPLAAATIDFTAAVAPFGAAFGSGGAVLAGPIPRYAVEAVGPATVVSIVGASTTMLIPFAARASASGFDTGLAVANTTTDPGTPMGVTSAVKQTGKITFYFYPAAPATASFTYTTAAGSPGTGLDASGNVPSGRTYSVLLSQLLAAAGQPIEFSGYIFVIANFTNAHCLNVVSNFTTFSQGAMALVITGSRQATREALNN